ncbi:3-dehydroquinate synthase, partial [Dehalococcoidia bacterium]|nr:3-dehydroquinate synthase [Dehalococcoidia bacterium]
QLMASKMPGKENLIYDHPDLAAIVKTSSGNCPLFVGFDLIPSLGELLHRAGITGPVYLITDDTVFGFHGHSIEHALEEAKIESYTFTFPAGEKSKTLGVATSIYEWLAEHRAQRNHCLVAVGGGVVGDLTGFVAATYNRGMHFVQVPTSLAAMVDASIGGKTAVDLPQAKNLIGAFYQPKLVVADVKTLNTLQQREIMEGWAEAIKHGLILDADLFKVFEDNADDLLALDPKLTTEVIRRSVAIKARVVSRDDRETLGYRTLLNYGHTIGHGLEAATEYGRFLHGEAVSIGMMGAARIGYQLGITPMEVVGRVEAILKRFHLPVKFAGIELAQVEAAMALDKKTIGAAIQWVLLRKVGEAILNTNVPQDLVRATLHELRDVAE